MSKNIPASSLNSLSAELKAQGCTDQKLRQMGRRVSNHYNVEIQKAGIKGTQYSMLTHIHRLGAVRPVDLAASLNITPSTLTRNMRPLIDAGWITLDAGTDARSRLVNLTPEGRAKREEARRRWDVAQKSLTEVLGAERVLALHQLLNESLELMAAAEAGEEESDDE